MLDLQNASSFLNVPVIIAIVCVVVVVYSILCSVGNTPKNNKTTVTPIKATQPKSKPRVEEVADDNDDSAPQHSARWSTFVNGRLGDLDDSASAAA
jgi:hypothetical protein